MSKWQIILLIVSVLVIIALIWAFWGTLFSLILTMGLIMIPSGMLLNRFVYSDRSSDFFEDDNG